MCTTLGATFDLALQVNTTFLIADQTQGQKYEAAVENAIPVLRSSFLADLHARWIDGTTDLDVLRVRDPCSSPMSRVVQPIPSHASCADLCDSE